MPSLATQLPETVAPQTIARRRWSPRSLAIIVLAWTILQLGGIFSPGLLDDVDSIYIQIAREMLHRHDFVTPTIDGIRFFDKPPLMYWMASTSMSVFGITDWAARLPLALAVLALLLSTYALGNRLFASVSPTHAPDRGGFYSALALATAIGPYLYTRFFIPDILIALWMTLGVHLFLIALERIEARTATTSGAPHLASEMWEASPQLLPQSTLLPALGFAAVMALNVLTKGLIGAVFPIGFVLLYLALTRRLHLLPRFHLLAGTAVFLAIAAPWHILAALRNPAIALPAGLGLPAHGGWAWFYLYNEHIARFLSKRIPHDYGQTPVWLFWLYTAIWTMPWTTFLPGAIAAEIHDLRSKLATETVREAALAPLLWAGLIVGFFTLSARQEYYALPAIPALTLMAGGLLARADRRGTIRPANRELGHESDRTQTNGLYLVHDDTSHTHAAARSAIRWSTFFLAPVATLIAILCGYFAILAPAPPPGATLSTLLATNPDLYNLSLGHLFDLTGPAMGLFRLPLAAVAIGMLTLGLGSLALRRTGRPYAANLTLAAGMTITLLAAHEGLVRFNPILGSKDLATAINSTLKPDDLILVDCELTCGSSLIFYTNHPVHVVNGHFNGLWYGSFWPDSPTVFEDDASLRALWASPHRVFLLTYHTAQRQHDLAPIGPAKIFAVSGGKSILTNR